MCGRLASWLAAIDSSFLLDGCNPRAFSYGVTGLGSNLSNVKLAVKYDMAREGMCLKSFKTCMKNFILAKNCIVLRI